MALGSLISGLIVFRFAPEAEGHGTDAAIAAFHHHPRGIRARIPVVKLVASAITIGSGGSGGREGPTAQISAGFGSFLGRLLDLDARDARIAVAVGMAAGIGAIFRAPLGGAILGAELLYREDVESDALVPSFVATIVAYSIFGAAGRRRRRPRPASRTANRVSHPITRAALRRSWRAAPKSVPESTPVPVR